MGLFGRKNEEEFDEEEGFSEEEELKDRKLTRKFRDLKSENRRKRKEPPKPWGNACFGIFPNNNNTCRGNVYRFT
jgi:hypothetical protein